MPGALELRGGNAPPAAAVTGQRVPPEAEGNSGGTADFFQVRPELRLGAFFVFPPAFELFLIPFI